MASLLVSPDGAVECASAGHPMPRVVHPGGAVEPVFCGGLALGIAEEQEYESVQTQLPPGGAVVLYTDGVIEARSGRELFGEERLDALLAKHAGELRRRSPCRVEACRAFSDGAPADDCAVVVIRRAWLPSAPTGGARDRPPRRALGRAREHAQALSAAGRRGPISSSSTSRQLLVAHSPGEYRAAAAPRGGTRAPRR
jgi:hypothetical protein